MSMMRMPSKGRVMAAPLPRQRDRALCNRGVCGQGLRGMRNGSRGVSAARAAMLAALGIACGVGAASAGDANRNARPPPGLAAGGKLAVETVYFADPRQAPVALV